MASLGASVPAALQGRRLLFTVTTGRSGTAWLAQALAAFPGVTARHEPRPRFSAAWRAVLASPAVAREFWLAEKLPAIARSRARVWAETSHLACKGFLESLLELPLDAELIHLQRDRREVAASLWSLNLIPGRTLRGARHFLAPSDPCLLPVRRGDAARWSDWQLCLWYCLEIEQRAARLERLWNAAGRPFHRAELADLLAPGGMLALGQTLRLPPPGPLGRLRLAALTRTRVNRKSERRRSEALDPAPLDEWEAQVRAAVAP